MSEATEEGAMNAMHLGRDCRSFRPALLALAAGLLAVEPSRADEGREASGTRFTSRAAATFKGRCTACHTYGKGVKVGPDLKGVTERRERAWLVRFIRGSSAMIASGDPLATALFSEFKRQRMPDWTDLPEQEIHDILDYLAMGGPELKPPDERSAETATASETELGRLLFDGSVAFRHGTPACTSCHSALGSRWTRGGSLGPDLSATYLEYQDRALTSFLRKPCFRWDSGSDEQQGLTPEESFAVKSFLRQSALQRKAGGGSAR
jgi:mono/diheme cytochrome c family protein